MPCNERVYALSKLNLQLFANICLSFVYRLLDSIA